ncbi:MAG: RNA-binding protein, partial [Candidatus Latescibacterota bacterium]
MVIVGSKPVMNYVMACVTILDEGERELVLRARGSAISKAVETVQILRRSFYKDIEVSDIKIGSDEFEAGGRIVSAS